MAESENKRPRRTPEERAAEISGKIDKLKGHPVYNRINSEFNFNDRRL